MHGQWLTNGQPTGSPTTYSGVPGESPPPANTNQSESFCRKEVPLPKGRVLEAGQCRVWGRRLNRMYLLSRVNKCTPCSSLLGPCYIYCWSGSPWIEAHGVHLFTLDTSISVVQAWCCMIAGFHAIIPWNQYYAGVAASHWVTSIQSELQQTSATIYDYESLIACFSAIKSTSSKIIILLTSYKNI